MSSKGAQMFVLIGRICVCGNFVEKGTAHKCGAMVLAASRGEETT